MNDFAELLLAIERCSDFSDKVKVLRDYFERVSSIEAAWTIYLLTNRETKVIVKGQKLRSYAQEVSGVSDWLFDESHSAVGDLSETIALLLPRAEKTNARSLSFWMEGVVSSIKNCLNTSLSATKETAEAEAKTLIIRSWEQLNESEKTIFNKILTGTLRFNYGKDLVIRVLAETNSVQPFVVAAKLLGDWKVTSEFFETISSKDSTELELLRPYSFVVESAAALRSSESLSSFAELSNLIVEWKWRGIRAQIVKRAGRISIWSIRQEWLTDLFPELVEEAKGLADGVVIDGYVLAFKDSDILPESALFQRTSKKNLTKQLMADVPVVFMAQDLLEENKISLEKEPIEKRKERLAYVLSSRSRVASEADFEQLTLFAPCQAQLSTKLRISPVLSANTIEELTALYDQCRMMKVAGLVLKKKGAAYGVPWLSWDLERIRMEAVLVAAQPAGGQRSGLFCDYTLAVWRNGELVTVARADSELNEDELHKVDRFIRDNVLAKYGPVVSVEPKLVLELTCEAVRSSQRHKSGIVLQGPRVIRLCSKTQSKDASSIDQLLRFCEY